METKQQLERTDAIELLQDLTSDMLEMRPELRCWILRRVVRFEPEASFELSYMIGQYRALLDAYLYHKHCSTLTPLQPDTYPELREQLIEIAGAETADALKIALAEFMRLLARL